MLSLILVVLLGIKGGILPILGVIFDCFVGSHRLRPGTLTDLLTNLGTMACLIPSSMEYTRFIMLHLLLDDGSRRFLQQI
jgi:hypothetical protein